MASEKLHNEINSLYALLQDSSHGYKECAENVKDAVLKSKFQDLSSKRQQMLDEIRKEANKLGETVDSSGTVSGAIHRVFVDVKSFFTRGDKDSVIKEIEHGEETLCDSYDELLHKTIPPSLKQVLQRQAETIKNDVQSIKSFYSS